MSQESNKAPANKTAPTGGQPNKNDDKRCAKTLTFTFSIPAVVAICIGSVLTCIWIFIMGVVLGSGYKPEETIPQLSELMPQSESKGQPPQIVTPEAPFGTPLTVTLEPEATPAKLMPTEELQYPNIVKDKPVETTSKRSVTVASSSSSSAAAPSIITAEKQTPVRQKEAITAPSKQQNVKEAQPEKSLVTRNDDTGEIFDYVFQVASFPDIASAETMVKQLKNAGIQSNVEASAVKGGTWYRCLVSFRGTTDSVDILREKLAQYKLTQLLRRSKVAVQQ